jgi:Uma2 family endonuclease
MLDPNLAREELRPLRRLEFERMVELGFFEDERIELLAGQLVEMSPIGSEHADVVTRLTELLIQQLGGRATVRPGLPLALGELSEPQPDLAVVPRGRYAADHPASAHLVVEVSDSSLRKDRDSKALIYAAASIPEYWIVNLVDRQVEVLSRPADQGYLDRRVLGRAEQLTSTELPELSVRVGDLLPD